MQITSFFAWYRAGKLLLRCCLVFKPPEVCNHRLNRTGHLHSLRWYFIMVLPLLSWRCAVLQGWHRANPILAAACWGRL